MKKLRVGLIYGGPSAEHDVSLASAKQVASNLDLEKYKVVKIKISKTGAWPKNSLPSKLNKKIDFAFIAMHGKYGEDGIVQAIMESQNIPYSGSGVAASSLAMDKYRTGLIASAINVKTPKTWLLEERLDISPLPEFLVIKPNDSGSSDRVKLVTKVNLKKEISKLSKKVSWLLQEKITGRELTVSVLGMEVLPIIEILPNQKFYDYKSKYTPGQSTHVVSPRLPISISKQLSKWALRMHRALGCQVVSRSDFIYDGRSIYFLETNTIPGLTPTSLLPEAAQQSGLSFKKLLDKIIELSS